MHVDPHHHFVSLLVNFCWRHDHPEYVSFVCSGWLSRFGHFAVSGNGRMPCNIAQICSEFVYSLV